MRLPVLTLLPLAGLATLAAYGAPAASAADGSESGPTVNILFTGYSATQVDILAGDSVTWRNTSFRVHSVAASDGSWTSERLPASAGFSRRFDAPGAVGYYCQLHPTMRGEVDVHQLLLAPPAHLAASGKPLVLAGRAALPAGSTVSIHAEGEAASAATATVDATGAFRATVRPSATTSYRAVAGEAASPPVQVPVVDQKLVTTARTEGRRAVVDVRALPGSPGATVVLQLRLRERFGWWPVRRARLDDDSHATLRATVRRPVRARVLITADDGATELARSATLRLRPQR
jgi:plastocyanin